MSEEGPYTRAKRLLAEDKKATEALDNSNIPEQITIAEDTLSKEQMKGVERQKQLDDLVNLMKEFLNLKKANEQRFSEILDLCKQILIEK